jgi:hypothetical protein
MVKLFLRSAFVALSLAMLPQVASAGTVTLAWDATPDGSVVGYSVLFGKASHTYTNRVDIGNVTTYTVDTGGTGTFYFAVCSRSASALSVPSNEVSTTIAGSNPILWVDYPSVGQVLPSDFVFSGWSADLGSQSGSGIDAIHVYAFPSTGAAPTFLGVASLGSARGDVAGAFGSQFMNSGFSLPVTAMAPGVYDIVAYGHSSVTGTFSVSRVVHTTILSPTVPLPLVGEQVFIDAPAQDSVVRGALTVRGWALDLRAPTGSGVDRVDVWGYPTPGTGQQPVFLGTAATVARPDVGGIFGTQFTNSGYMLGGITLTNGVWDLAVDAHSTVTGGYDRQRVVRVNVQQVMVDIDAPAMNASVNKPFFISGWAADFRATVASGNSGIDAIHVWAFPSGGAGSPVFLGVATQGLTRNDVASFLGSQYAHSGYYLTVSSLASGTYDVVVYAHSSISGVFDNAALVHVVVK